MLNVTLEIEKNKEILLNNLSNKTSIPKDSFINDIVNGERDWQDFEDLNECLERKEKNPNEQLYTSKEAKKILGI